MLYRIYTEDKNPEKIEAIVSHRFPGFTLSKAEGFWRFQKENSLIIEVVIEEKDDPLISDLAREIKEANEQESVLIQRIANKSWLV